MTMVDNDNCNFQLQQTYLAHKVQMTLYHHNPTQLRYQINWPILPNFYGIEMSDDVQLELKIKDLWNKFNEQTTEMIVTKSGRRMFPQLFVDVTGLEPNMMYCVVLEMVPATNYRYKYVNYNDEVKKPGNEKGWRISGPADIQSGLQNRIYLHPNSPSSGSKWMDQHISFAKVKLTNNQLDPQSNLVLNSMHKYIPRIWIINCNGVQCCSMSTFPRPSKCFTFEETSFVAVTAYQNTEVTKIKIDNNPFAKGFRRYKENKSIKDTTDKGINSDEDETKMIPCLTSKPETQPTLLESFVDNNHSLEILSPPRSIASSSDSNTSPESLAPLSPQDFLQENQKIADISGDLQNLAMENTSSTESNKSNFHRPWLDSTNSEESHQPTSCAISENHHCFISQQIQYYQQCYYSLMQELPENNDQYQNMAQFLVPPYRQCHYTR